MKAMQHNVHVQMHVYGTVISSINLKGQLPTQDQAYTVLKTN